MKGSHQQEVYGQEQAQTTKTIIAHFLENDVLYCVVRKLECLFTIRKHHAVQGLDQCVKLMENIMRST